MQKEDISSELINTVNLEYNYNAAYSTGTMDATANAEARVVVLPFTPHSYVVDFGLPVTFDFSTQIQEANGNIEFESVSSKNGADVSIIEGTQSIKYELNKTMAGPDEVTIQLKGTTGSISFYVIPATTVYYEEGFADFSLWNQESVGSKGTDEQTASYFGQSERYGYDEKYSREAVGPSNGTEAVSTAAGDKADFMFTGTGVEIYANCTNETGLATIQIIDENGRTIRLLQVDTKTDNGSSDATVGQDTESYNLPIASVKGLDHGKYKVRVTHSMRGVGNVGGNLRLDGWRVFGTADNTPAVHDDVYVKDGEANPTFFELRNQVLAGLNVNITGSIYEEAGSILNQVYDSIGTKTGAIIIGNATDYDVQDLLDNGPKNELFLRPGETVTFALSDEVTSAQVGLKAVNAAVNYTMNGQAIDLTSSTDMFYDIDLKSGKNVTITNNNGGILSITKIKAFGVSGSDNIFADVQQEAIVSALLSLGFKEEVQIVHGTSKDDAVEYVQPTGKDDAYQSGEWCIYEGQYYSCKEDGTMGDPKASPQCWKKMNVNNNGKGNGNKK